MRRIANYLVEDEPIAKGGMGQIFRGMDEQRNPIAIKEILPEFTNDWSIITRIEKEVDFLVKIDHPSIVKLHAAFKDPSTDCYYIVMEFVEGVNIEQYVIKNGAIPPDIAIDMMMKILDAMQCVHNEHIIHRDIKPSNIMIRDDGRICLLDFGVAKDANPANGKSLTVMGSIIGTNGYMSPEQADGFAIDYRTDIYALGCVFYYMLTGHHAFNTLSSEFETKDAILNGEFPRLSKYKSGLPDVLQRIIDKATAKNMTKRYRSCYEFMTDMRNGTHVSNAGQGIIPLKISIGRDLCDIIMDDPERKISRHHVDIELKEQTGGKYYILTDCSSNGTLVKDKMLRKSSVSINASGPYPEVYLAGIPEGKLDWQKVIREIDKKRQAVRVIDEESGNENAKDNETKEDEYKQDVEIKEKTENDSLGKSATGWLIAAYIFAVLGGLFGVIIGAMIASQKQKQLDGTKKYVYKKADRRYGLIAAIVAIISMIIWKVSM